jgi:hypothetical protein
MRTLGQIAYEAYYKTSYGVSLISGVSAAVERPAARDSGSLGRRGAESSPGEEEQMARPRRNVTALGQTGLPITNASLCTLTPRR